MRAVRRRTMNERMEVQAARLQTVGGKVCVSALPGPDATSDGGIGNWGNLYAVSHLHAGGPAEERIRDRVEGVAEESYRRSPGGVTNRLRQAVRNANRYVYLRNRVRGERPALLAALGCAAVRGTDVYACGVGPHSIFVLSQGRVRSYVNNVSRASQDTLETWGHNGHALGRSATLSDPKFSYRQIGPGDLLLIVAGDHVDSFEQAVAEAAARLEASDVEAAARELAGLLGAEMQVSALLLRLLTHDVGAIDRSTFMPKDVPDSAASPSRAFALPWKRPTVKRDEPPSDEPLDEPIGLDDEGTSFLDTPVTRLLPTRRTSHDSHLRDDLATSRARAQSSPLVERGAETCRAGGMLVVSLVAGLLAGVLGLLRSLGNLVKGSWGWMRRHRVLQRVARGIQLAIVGLWAGVKGLVVGILPERQGTSRTYAASARPMVRAKVLVFHPSRRTRALIGAVILLGAAVLVGTSFVRIKARLAQADVEEVASEVEEYLMLADAEDETEARMALLAEAQAVLDQAPEGQLDTAELTEVRGELARRWDGLTGAVRLPLSEELAWSAPERTGQRIIVHQDSVYVLDQAGQFIYQYALDEQEMLLSDQEPAVYELPSQEGELPTGQIVDIVGVDAANGRQTPALLILATDSSVLELDTSGSLRSVPVSQLKSLESPGVLGTYEGNLYVLDPDHQNIVKYVPYDDDYQHDPVDYVRGAADVRWPDVVDMAIDGFVYLLLSDGTITKFGGGEAQPFPQEGLYPPLENPTGIFAAPDATSVFVADASEGRIVEFTRDGQFVRQFRAALDGEDHLGAMTAFAVDVAHSRLLISTPSGLYSASLPSLQQ
jgi:hypothetical protein